jgi:hypothetical protein
MRLEPDIYLVLRMVLNWYKTGITSGLYQVGTSIRLVLSQLIPDW